MLRLRFLLLSALLGVATVLAGCASPATDPAQPPTNMTAEQAHVLLANASSQMPEKYAVKMVMSSSGKDVMTMSGAFDNASKTSYVDVKGDPAAFGRSAQMAGPFLQNGLQIYVTPEGSLYLANGTAFVFPPSGDDAGNGLLPAPDKGPLGEFTDPAKTFGAFARENVTIKSVTPTTLRGKSAVEIVATTVQDGKTVDATITAFTDPARLGRVQTTLPRDEQNPGSPLSGASLVADIYYDADATMQVPASAQRSIGLAYKSEGDAWTFLVSGGVALDEVEAQVKDGTAAASQDGMGATEPGALPTLWSMKLSEGTKTQDGLTLKFDDVDHDGKVSKGDRLTRTSTSNEGAPTLVLYDTVSKTYVVPGLGVAALVGLAVVVALARRR